MGNHNGMVRLKYAKKYFEPRLERVYSENTEDSYRIKSDLLRTYRMWKDTDEYIAFEKGYEGIDPFCQSVTYVSSGEGMVAKSSKRGNDVYRNRISKRLQPLLDYTTSHRDYDFSRNTHTRAIFLTLTFDANGYYGGKPLSMGEAWDSLSSDWNIFITRLRQIYGEVSVFRVYEVFRSGYPHIHAVILFKDKSFRVIGKEDIPTSEFKNIDKLWHSNIRISSIRNTGKAIGYLTKYLTKAISTDQHEFCLAMLWIKGKRSYSISGDFIKTLHSLIQIMHNSKSPIDLISYLPLEPKEIYKYLGVIPANILDLHGFYQDIEPPDLELIKFYVDTNKGY